MRILWTGKVRRSCGAFSLVETLVAAGLLAALGALTLPSLDWTKYQSDSARCLNDKRTIMQGLHLYAEDHNGRYPYHTGGFGSIMNPGDHEPYKQKVLAEQYGVPYGMWMCAVGKPDMAARSAQISNLVVNAINSGAWKWFGSGAVCYWVEQGGGQGGAACCENIPRGIFSSIISRQNPANVVLSDYLFVDAATNVSGAVHTFKGELISSPVACADGHVELRPKTEIRMRFFYAWNFGY